jgi:hypothetical protein
MNNMDGMKDSKVGIGLSKLLKPGEKSDGVSVVVMNNNILKYLRKIDRASRWDRVFLRGILGGLGSAIGATLVFALVIFLLINIAKNVPFIDNAFNNLVIKNAVNNYLGK